MRIFIIFMIDWGYDKGGHDIKANLAEWYDTFE